MNKLFHLSRNNYGQTRARVKIKVEINTESYHGYGNDNHQRKRGSSEASRIHAAKIQQIKGKLSCNKNKKGRQKPTFSIKCVEILFFGFSVTCFFATSFGFAVFRTLFFGSAFCRSGCTCTVFLATSLSFAPFRTFFFSCTFS